MSTRALALSAAVVALGACTSSTYVNEPPPVEDRDQVATVTVVRCKSMWGALSPITVQMDGRELLKIKQGFYTSFAVSADAYNREHTFQIDMPFKEDPLSPYAPSDQVNLICEPGEEIFVVIDFGERKNFLRRVSEEEARPCLEEAKPMEP